MRTIVYIDGQNFLHRVAEILIERGVISDRQELNEIDLEYLMRRIFPREKFRIRYYGVAKIPHYQDYGEEIAEKSQRYADNLRRLRNGLRKNGVEYRGVGSLKVRGGDECRRCGAADYKLQEKGVDVGLAVDILKDVLGKKVGRVILVCSDSDLGPALKVVRAKGVRLTYVAFEGQVTRSLARLANEVKVMRDREVVEAFVRGMN